MGSEASAGRSPALSLLLGEQGSLRSHLAGEIYSAVRFPRRTLRQIAQALSGHDAFVDVGETLMRVPSDMYWAFADGDYYERNVGHWLTKLVSGSRGRVLYDVGANYGYYCLKLARVASHIHAFEPVNSSYHVLADNLERNGISNVTAHKLAVGDTAGAMEMYVYTSSGNNSLVPVRLGRYHRTRIIGREIVDVARLDAVLQESQLEPPDVVKVDIEGGELPALRGARETIDKHRPALLFESFDPLSEAAGYRRSDLLNEVDRHDSYVIRGLAEDADDLKAYGRAELERLEVRHIMALPSERADLLWN